MSEPTPAPRSIVFTVPLAPKGKRSIRVASGRAYLHGDTRNYMGAVAFFAGAAIKEPLEGPLRVDILAVMPRPKRLRTTWKRTGEPRHWPGFIWCPQKPDKDNIEKAIYDGMSSCWTDDKQVVAGETLKVYSELHGKPRVVVRVTPLPSGSPHYGPMLGDPAYMARKLGLD